VLRERRMGKKNEWPISAALWPFRCRKASIVNVRPRVTGDIYSACDCDCRNARSKGTLFVRLVTLLKRTADCSATHVVRDASFWKNDFVLQYRKLDQTYSRSRMATRAIADLARLQSLPLKVLVSKNLCSRKRRTLCARKHSNDPVRVATYS